MLFLSQESGSFVASLNIAGITWVCRLFLKASPYPLLPLLLELPTRCLLAGGSSRRAVAVGVAVVVMAAMEATSGGGSSSVIRAGRAADDESKVRSMTLDEEDLDDIKM